MPRVELVQKHNFSARRLYIRGNNGKVCLHMTSCRFMMKRFDKLFLWAEFYLKQETFYFSFTNKILKQLNSCFQIYPYLVVNDACMTESRREERILQLLRLLNLYLEKRKVRIIWLEMFKSPSWHHGTEKEGMFLETLPSPPLTLTSMDLPWALIHPTLQIVRPNVLLILVRANPSI